MATYLLENRDGFIEYVSPERPASATLSFKDPSGSELATPTATVDPTSTTVTAVTSTDEFTVGSALVPGREYLWVSTSDGAHASLVRCAEYDGRVVKLESPPAASVVVVGDLIVGARITATIPASALATRDLHYRAEWTVTGADGLVRVYTQEVHVGRTLFRPACTPDQAARYLSGAFPHLAVERTWGYFAELARRASARVERKLIAGKRYPNLVGDSNAFGDAGLVALRVELAQEGLIPPGFEPTGYMRSQEQALGEAVNEAISGLWYDKDDDGAVGENETEGFYAISMVRR